MLVRNSGAGYGFGCAAGQKFRARPGPTTNKGDETGRDFHLSGSQTVASRCSNRPTLPRVNVWPNNSEGRKCQKICPECLSDGRYWIQTYSDLVRFTQICSDLI